MNFRNVSIRVRLIIGFSLVVCFLIITGFVGWNGLANTFKATKVSGCIYGAEKQLLSARLKALHFFKDIDFQEVENVDLCLDSAICLMQLANGEADNKLPECNIISNKCL